MSKHQQNHKESKKKPAMTMKEKRESKKAKKVSQSIVADIRTT
ncbi:MAG: hypothetical protein P8178_13225 [Candidatus Thiodiazotropha sp.]